MSFFFPEMQYIGGAVWAGHGALAMGIGLAIGLVVWAARRRQNRWMYLVVPVVYGWAVWEHIMANWYGGSGCARSDMSLCTVADVDLRGRIFPIVILLGWGLAIYMSGRAIRSLKTEDSLLGDADFTMDGYRSDGPIGVIRYVRDWFAFRRWRRKTAFGVATLRHGRRYTEDDLIATMGARLRGLALRESLGGEGQSQVSEDLHNAIVRSAPFD